MIYIADENEGESSRPAIEYHLPALPQPRVVWHIDDGPTPQHLEYHLSGSEEGDAHQDWMHDAHRWHQHHEDDCSQEWEEEEEDWEEEEYEEDRRRRGWRMASASVG